MSIEVKPSSERKCTNVPALVFAIVFISITVILVSCCGAFAYKSWKKNSINSAETSELKDSCGYICGQSNARLDSNCGDPDKSKLPKLLIDINIEDKDFIETKICVEECPDEYLDISNKCVKEDFMSKMVNDLKVTWYYILIICFVAFVFSYIVLLLFRHAAIYVIWIINIAFVVLVVGFAVFCAVYKTTKGAVTFGIIGLIMVIVLLCFRKRIALVAKLFKEASKALIDVPVVMFEPILTFISLLISFLIFATFAVIIEFADENEPLAKPAHICNFISFIFITQFIIGCQNFIIAGTICRWYFTRDKKKLRKPIKKSFSHLFKFHLGSVCFSAILMTIVKLIKIIICYLKSSAKSNGNGVVRLIAACLMCLLNMIDKMLSFLVRNAYIVIAKEGTPFCESGKRAYRLLMDNITDVIALNHFGDFVLFVCRLLIVLITGCVGYTVLNQNMPSSDYIALPLILGLILAFLIAHCFVMVFEMTVDTIFISFCIDLEENDGQTKPYYMSDSLKQIITEMKDNKGENLTKGPKSNPGIENEMSGRNQAPMMQQPPVYPQMGYGYQPQYPQTQQPYPQQQGYPSAPHNTQQKY